MILEELVAVLGFEMTGEDDLQNFQKGLDEAAGSARAFAEELFETAQAAAQGLAAISGTVAGVATALTAFASQTADRLAFVDDAAERTGLSFKRMQELAAAGQIAGVEAANFTGTVEEMTRRLAEAARGSGQAKAALEQYGLSAVDASGKIKQADQFLLEVSDRLQTLGAAEQLDLASKLGISREVLTMLRSGRKDIELYVEQAREAGLIFDGRVRDRYADFQDSLNLLSQTFRAVKDRLVLDYMPAMTDVIDQTQEWLRVNRDAIREDIGGAIERTAKNIRFLFKQIGTGEVDFEKLYAGFFAVSRLISKRLFWLQAAFIAFDDVVTGLRGGESYTKDFIDGFDVLLRRIDRLKAELEPLADKAKSAFESVREALGFGPSDEEKARKARGQPGPLEAAGPQSTKGTLGQALSFVQEPGGPIKTITPFEDELVNEDGTISQSTAVGMLLQRLIFGNRAPAQPQDQGQPPRGVMRGPTDREPTSGPRDRSGFPFTAPLSERTSSELASQAGQVTQNIDNSRHTDVDARFTVNVTQTPASGQEIGSSVADALSNRLTVHSDSPVIP